MADAGDLGKLPLELRKQVYTHLLVEFKKVTIIRFGEEKKGRVVRIDHHRRYDKHRGQVYNRRRRRWVKAPCKTGLLLANKMVNQEAAPVFYRLNVFEFMLADALECFLECLGDSRQYLRHLAFDGRIVLHRYKWNPTERSLQLLAQAGGLRSLELSHAALCSPPRVSNNQWVSDRSSIWDTNSLAGYCKHLLKSLKASLDRQDLKMSILDMIKIVLPPCALDDGCKASHDSVHARSEESYRGIPVNGYNLVCTCACEAAEENNRKLVQSLKKEIARHLGLDIDQKEKVKEIE